MHAQSFNVWLFVTLWIVAGQATHPWTFPGKTTGVGCHFLLQGVFPIQGSNPWVLRLLHWQAGSLPLSHLGRVTSLSNISSHNINIYTVSDFILGGSKITADGDCSHEIKRRLLLGRKVMTNLDSILKSRDITLPTEVRLVKAMVFPVVMYGCESWTVKKAERRKIDAFEL